MQVNEVDILVGALTIYGEARGEDLQGQIAVAHVLINRAKAKKWWGKRVEGLPDHSLAAVCLKPWQFSVWNPNDPNRAKLVSLRENYARAITDPVCRRALKALIDALDGYVPDPTGGACHYVTNALYQSGKAPDWAQGRQHIRIGSHLFFPDVD